MAIKSSCRRWWRRSRRWFAASAQLPKSWLARLLGAWLFYTCMPLPSHWPVTFTRIAAYGPLVGVGVGLCLMAGDQLLSWVQMPELTRSALLVALWVGVTGGLHLDGAMDTADGLGVSDPQRRLAVMADSRTGAFGAIAGVVIWSLKVAALAEIPQGRWLVLLTIPCWGRWAQVVAIARYPYLKPEGKGAFHKTDMVLPADWLPGGIALVALAWLDGQWGAGWVTAISTCLGSSGVAIAVGAWFNHRLGGHTGDTYGAVVEWTEALLLCGFTLR